MTQACVRVLLQIYHACDGPGLSILCFMRYDVMEYFSVYGTALSMWVTLIGESPALRKMHKTGNDLTTTQQRDAGGSDKLVL